MVYKRKKRKGRGFKNQLKPEFGKKGDRFEKEADEVADGVVKMASNKKKPESITILKDEDQIQMKPLENPEIMMAPELSSESNSGNSLGQFGQPLGIQDKEKMEDAMGSDFSEVRIHNDKNAALLSQSFGARAFTYKNHIYFNEGEYQPNSTEGKHLLAHELTHVVQQGSAKNNAVPTIQKQEVERPSVVTSAPVLNQAGSLATGLGAGFVIGWAFDALRDSINSMPIVPVERQDIESFFAQVSSGRRLRPMDILRTRLGSHVRNYRTHRAQIQFIVMERARSIDSNLNVAQRIDAINAFFNEFQTYHNETLESSFNIDLALTLRSHLQRNIQSATSLLGHLEAGYGINYMFYTANLSIEEIVAIQGNVAHYLGINRETLANLEQLQAIYNEAVSQNENILRRIRQARWRGRFSETPIAESDSPYDD